MHHLHFFSAYGALSVSVAIFAAWTALDLLRQVPERQGNARLPWLITASVAMGGGVWSMHFIAMLGFNPGPSIGYAPVLTGASLGLALIGTALAFFAASLGKGRVMLLCGGVIMGLSIAAMHYVGMAAIRTNALFIYAPTLVVASVLIAIAASTAALFAAEHQGGSGWRFLCALVLGLAVVGMHYTGMAAMTVVHGPSIHHEMDTTSQLVLAFAVAGVSMFILIMAVVVSMLSQRDKLMSIIDAGDIGYWEVPMHTRTPWMSPRARRFLNLPPNSLFSAQDLDAHLAVVDPEILRQAMNRALNGDGEYDMEYFLPTTRRWLHFRGKLIRSRAGKPLKLAGVVIDVTDRHTAFSALETSEHRQRLLLNELNHRVKNTLATIQSIAALTARRTSSTEEFMALFESRLIALSDTHHLLTANGWERARLRDLIHQEFRPFAEDQLKIEGPEVTLGPEQALSMSLILHELVTNAAKYGALSPRDTRGRVRLKWTINEAHGTIHLIWTEEGGPVVSLPSRRGFGSRLIETSVKGVLRGKVVTDYSHGALKCEMVFHPTTELRPETHPETQSNGPLSAAIEKAAMSPQGTPTPDPQAETSSVP